MDRAGDESVGIPQLYHHHSVVHRVGCKLRRRLFGDSLRLAQLEERGCVSLEARRIRRDGLGRDEDWVCDSLGADRFRRLDLFCRQHGDTEDHTDGYHTCRYFCFDAALAHSNLPIPYCRISITLSRLPFYIS